MRSKGELRELVWEHLDWLRASAQRFDEGRISESKRIAVAVRTLVHDTRGPRSSRSLLSQLGILDEMPWLSSVALTESGFATPPWIDDPHSAGFAPIHGTPPFTTDFATWWRGAMLRIGDSTIDRSWLVLQVANFDGGAHVDPELPVDYESLSRAGGLRPLRINSAGASYSDTSNPVPNGLRTICTEVVTSIEAAL